MANKKKAPEGAEAKVTWIDSYAEGNSLEWLDLLVHFTLNPEKHFVESITSLDKQRIENLLNEESMKLRGAIQHQVFSVHTKNEAELFVRNYHTTLTVLLGQSFNNLEGLPAKEGPAKEITALLILFFEELISFIEVRFAWYLSLDEYVPKSYFRLAQKELASRLKKLQDRIQISNPQKISFEIIVNKLNRFLNTNEFEHSTSYKNILYKKKLIGEVEKIDFTIGEFQSYTKLDTTLIYLNFNSVEYINYLISHIKKQVNNLSTIEEKKRQLYFLFKSFNQLYKKPNTAYNEHFHSVEMLLNNWFNQELSYLEKIQSSETTPAGAENPISKIDQVQNRKLKVLCILSSDQLGLILRAADELRILVAKSMNEVFKTIVPSLSTPARENLSYDGMRSKSYAAEERDKKITIEALEQMIEKIKEY